MDALDLMNALEQCVASGRAIHNYHQHFVKLIVREFLEEASKPWTAPTNAPAFGLQESGLAAMARSSAAGARVRASCVWTFPRSARSSSAVWREVATRCC